MIYVRRTKDLLENKIVESPRFFSILDVKMLQNNFQREQGTGNFLTGKTHVFKHEIEIMTLFFFGLRILKNIFFLTEL